MAGLQNNRDILFPNKMRLVEFQLLSLGKRGKRDQREAK